MGRTDSARTRRSFNSLAPRGANPRLTFTPPCGDPFQLTRPAGGANLARIFVWKISQSFQLTRPAGGEPTGLCVLRKLCRVSTHSPRGGRTLLPPTPYAYNRVSTHSPRGGRTTGMIVVRIPIFTFQLTRPAGGEPRHTGLCMASFQFQLTRPAGGEPIPPQNPTILYRVSTHSPRGGRTFRKRRSSPQSKTFQLTRPAGGANH